jgi:hypothetical protein
MRATLNSRGLLKLSIILFPILILGMLGCTGPTSMEFERLCKEKLLALAKAQIEYKDKNGKYGNLSDIQTAEAIEKEKISNTTTGYEIALLMSETQDKFTIVAWPKDDPALKTYLVNAAQKVTLLTPTEIKEPGPAWKSIISAETMYMDEDKHFIWSDIAEYRNQDATTDLMLDPEGSVFILTNPRGDYNAAQGNNIGPEFIYLSTTGKFYKMSQE